MPKEPGPEALEGAAEALRKVAAAVRTTNRPMSEVSLEKAIGRATASEEARKAAAGAMSIETGSPEFLLDMWVTEGRTQDQVLSAVEEARRKLLEVIEVKRHPDNVPELLSGEKSFGLIFLPKKLMVDLYRLGEGALEIMEGRRKADAELEALNMRVLEQAKDWVTYCRRKWGPPPDSEIVPVSPLSKEDVETAKPDEPGDPPF